MEILLVSAVSWEMRPILNLLRRRAAVAVGQDGTAKVAYGQVRLTALSVGMGAGRAVPRFQAALDAHHPAKILLVGFSGGVKEGQRMGSIALPRLFLRQSRGPNALSGSQDASLRSDLAAYLKGKGITLLCEDKEITVEKLAGPSQKLEIGRVWPDACGVDMESYALAESCARTSIPFLCMRAIFDEAKESLPSTQNFWKLPWWYWRASTNLAVAAMFLLEQISVKP